jgi:hypothetical protein
VLISSLLAACILLITNTNNLSPDGTIHVKNEEELLNAINKVKKPTTIQINNDITLTKPLNIPNKKT